MRAHHPAKCLRRFKRLFTRSSFAAKHRGCQQLSAVQQHALPTVAHIQRQYHGFSVRFPMRHGCTARFHAIPMCQTVFINHHIPGHHKIRIDSPPGQISVATLPGIAQQQCVLLQRHRPGQSHEGNRLRRGGEKNEQTVPLPDGFYLNAVHLSLGAGKRVSAIS